MKLRERVKAIFGDGSKKSSLIKTGCVLLALLIANAVIAIPFIISGELRELTAIGLALRITGFTVSAIWLAAIVAGRLKKAESILRGLFFYGLLGILFFAIALIAKLAAGQQAGFAVQSVFDWFSVAQRPLAYVMQPLIGMSEFYSKGIIFGLLTVSSGIAARSVLNQKQFEKKMAEKERFEAESKKST